MKEDSKSQPMEWQHESHVSRGRAQVIRVPSRCTSTYICHNSRM
jgi:hypothetical protein